MKPLRTLAAAVIAASFSVDIACKPTPEVHPEQPATIRLGELAAIRVDSERHYSMGSAGDALTLIQRAEERTTTVYVLRAVAPGLHTVVLTPRDPGPDGCVSCVTLHYFITVLGDTRQQTKTPSPTGDPLRPIP
jgi:hypothetical protein